MDNFVSKPVVWLFPIFFVVRRIEKKKLLSSLGFTKRNLLEFIIVGIIGALLFFFYLKIFGMVIFHTTVQLDYQKGNIFEIIMILIYAVITAVIEETVFRGYLQARLTNILHSNFLSIGISSVLFALIHTPISIYVYHFTIDKIFIYELYLLEVSILYALHFTFSKSLTSSIAAHATIDFLSDLLI